MNPGAGMTTCDTRPAISADVHADTNSETDTNAADTPTVNTIGTLISEYAGTPGT